MRLMAVLDSYQLAKIDLSLGSIQQLRHAISVFGQFLLRDPEVSDLSVETTCRFMQWMLHRGRSPRTVNGKRASLLTLWRFAFDRGFTDRCPGRVAKAKEPRKIPVTFSDEEFAALVAETENVRHGPILRAVLLVAWDTSSRIGSILKMAKSDFDRRNGLLTVYETKTRTQVVRKASPQTIDALSKLSHDGDSLFGWKYSDQTLRDWLAIVQSRLGFPSDRRRKFHCVRRTKYTAVYAKFGQNAASDHAGHLTNMSKSYLDTRRLVTPDICSALPPPVMS